MKISALHIGMKVKHPQYGEGEVKTIAEHTAEILFSEGRKTIEPEGSDLQPAEAQASVSGLNVPLKDFVDQVVSSTVEQLGFENPKAEVNKLDFLFLAHFEDVAGGHGGFLLTGLFSKRMSGNGKPKKG